MKLCFRSDEPTGGLGYSDQGAVFGLLRPDTASRMLVTQLLVLGDLFVRASHRISSYSYSAKRYSVRRGGRYSYSMAVLTSAMPIVDRGGFAGTCGPIIGRIAILDRIEYEYRDAEYEKKHEQCGAPKSPTVLS